MQKLGFSVLLGYRFICDCGKSLSCPFYSKGEGVYQKIAYYKQCECCGRIYKISLDMDFDRSEEEALKIDDLMKRIVTLNVEADALAPMGQVELQYDPKT